MADSPTAAATNPDLAPWSVAAVNLPDHADNIIHTDAGAIAAGFERALVAGTTIYAYMTHPAVAAWGKSWLSSGGGELRLRKPVFDQETVDCLIATGDEGPVVSATVGGDERATLSLLASVEAPAVRSGQALTDVAATLTEPMLDYGARCGDDLAIYATEQIAHPVTWVNLANRVFIENLVTGPWIHVRSKIYHEGVATLGESIRVTSTLIDRFDSRAGERALVDMRIFANDRPVATIEHEAIIVLAS